MDAMEENKKWVIEVAFDNSNMDEYNEKHILIYAETNKEAAEFAYKVSDEVFPEWSDSEIVICGREKRSLSEFRVKNGIHFLEL